MRLLPPASHLDFVPVEILSPLFKTQGGNEYIVVIKNHYSKLSRAIPSEKTTAARIADIFMEHWMANVSIPFTLLTDN